MAYIVVSAGWNANHQVVEFFNNESSSEKKRNAFYQSNEKPRLLLIERKGAAAIDSLADELGEKDASFDSSYSDLHSNLTKSPKTVDLSGDSKSDSGDDEKLVEQVFGWEGDVEIHRQDKVVKNYGWSRLWNSKWKSLNRNNLLVLPELHQASPPELASFKSGYERISEAKYFDEVEDEMRIMAEDCDRIEGFVYLSDAFDGFSGVTNKVAESNQDEFNRKSLLINLDEPWSRVSPFSLICQAMSLQTSCDLILPMCSASATSTAVQSVSLQPTVSQILTAVESISIASLANFLVPFRQNIICPYSSDSLDFALSDRLSAVDTDEFERSLTWLKTDQLARGKRNRNVKPRVLTTMGLADTTGDKMIDNDLCLWYNKRLNCAARALTKTGRSTTRLTSLRNSNEIHHYLAQLVAKVGRFSPKLTGFDQDDWDEKVEYLANLRDLTKHSAHYSTSSSDSDSE